MTGAPFVDDLIFPEALRWHAGRLWFVDMFGGRVCNADETGALTVAAEFTDRTSGIGFLPDPERTPLVVLMDTARVMRVGPSAPEPLAKFDIAPGQYLNDMIVDRNGRAYVDCVGDGGPDTPGDSLVLLTPDGAHRLATTEPLYGPNGMAITPDGGTLILAEPSQHRLTAFAIAPDGALTDRRVFANTGEDRADGICLDAEGAVWFGSGRRGRFVRIREGGEVTDVIHTGERWAIDCVVGGEDRRTLFMGTAKVPPELATRGLTLPQMVTLLRRSQGSITTTLVSVAGAGTP